MTDPKSVESRELRERTLETASNFAALPVGHHVGAYELIGIIGQGSFGITYRGLDTRSGRTVAIKEYLPAALAVRRADSTVVPRSTDATADFEWGLRAFEQEGQTLTKFTDVPGVVRILDFFAELGTAFIVMELLEGETLEAMLKHGEVLDPTRCDLVLRTLMDGLERVHAEGFLHRDIKPANVMFDREGYPKLIDFGASRAAMANRTQAMTAIFTPGYAALEQFSASRQGPWTDIYGLSATLYHAATGKQPPAAFDRVIEDQLIPLSHVIPEMPLPILAAIDAGLRLRAEERPQSIKALRAIMDDPNATVVMRAPAQTVVIKRPGPKTPSSRRGLIAAVAAGVAILVVLGGGAYLMRDRFMPTPAPSPVQATVIPQAPQPDPAIEARVQAERDATLRKQVEEDTRKRVEAEIAERQRQEKAEADRVLAEKAERERLAAKAKSEADEAKAQAEAEAKAAAEAKAKAEENDRIRAEQDAGKKEDALNLTQQERENVQIALTALGFNTDGVDGRFGSKSRRELAKWQEARKLPGTGHIISRDMLQALLKEAAPAVAKAEADKKAAEEKAKVEAETKAKAEAEKAQAKPTVAAAAPATSGGDIYSGRIYCNNHVSALNDWQTDVTVIVNNGKGAGSRGAESLNGPNQYRFSVEIDDAGKARARWKGVPPNTAIAALGACEMDLSGKVTTDGLRLSMDQSNCASQGSRQMIKFADTRCTLDMKRLSTVYK